MRKITQLAVASFFGEIPISKSNTVVAHEEHLVKMYLHGNLIATRDKETGKIVVTLAGWPTPTTKERLNGILDFLNISRIHQKKGIQYFGNTELDHNEWLTVVEETSVEV